MRDRTAVEDLAAGRRAIDLYELAGRAHAGQWPQQHGVDGREDGRIESDADREGEYDDRRKERTLDEHASGKPKVLA